MKAALVASLLITITALAYARYEVRHALMIRVAACEMLGDRTAWDDFECSRALREAAFFKVL